MPGDNQFVEVGRLLGGELLKAKIVQDEQVGAEEGADWGDIGRSSRGPLDATAQPG